MTDDPKSDLDERVARLAARRAGAAKPAPETATVAGGTKIPLTFRRRNHPASTSRLVAGWMSTSVFLSIVVAFSVQQPSSASTTYAAAAPRGRITPVTRHKRKVVVKEVHHKVYVDAAGNPISPSSIPKGASLTPQTATGGSVAPPAGSVGRPASSPAPAFGAPASGGGNTRATPATFAPAPTSGPAPAPTPHPGQPTPPPTTPHPTTPPTVAPKPTPTTVFVPPPPPSPPPCSGTKCP